MNPPQQYTVRLADRIDYNDTFSQYRFELVQPTTIENLAGQYVMFQIDPTTARAYSMSDRPDVNSSFELLVDHSPAGPGVTYLRNLAFGATATVIAPLGHFTYRDDPSISALYYFATGCGISAIKSMITDRLQNHQDPRPITLYWGLRHDSDFFWLETFQELADSFPNFTFVPIVSQPSPAYQGLTGRVTDILPELPTNQKAQYYFCGNQKMIDDATAFLSQEKHIPAEQIISEQFTKK